MDFTEILFRFCGLIEDCLDPAEWDRCQCQSPSQVCQDGQRQYCSEDCSSGELQSGGYAELCDDILPAGPPQYVLMPPQPPLSRARRDTSFELESLFSEERKKALKFKDEEKVISAGSREPLIPSRPNI